MENDIEQRVWKLEQQVADLNEIKTNQLLLITEFQRFKGFIGGVLFVGGALAVGLNLLLSWIKG